jgi:SPP1 gp7 family putative phage head morphogenesis protein
MRNAEYWAERALNEALMGERSVLEYENALLDAYRVALREIKKDLESFFSKYARENKVTYAEARRRLVSAEMKEFKATVKMWLDHARQNGWNRVYIQYLEKLLNMKYITRLEMLEADIRYQIELIENNKEKNIKDLMEINYLAAYYVRYHDFATGAEMSVRFDTIDTHTLAQAVAKKWDDGNYSTRVWNDRNRLVKAMATILPQSFSRGLNVNKLGDMLAKELNVSQNRGRTLARTEINNICNQADLAVYKAAGIEKYQFVATLDLRTSEICRSMDNTVHEVSQARTGINFPPLHPNCRSTTVAYHADLQGLERVAKDSEGKNIRVSRSMSQEEWIKKYAPEEDRDKLLQFTSRFYKSQK